MGNGRQSYRFFDHDADVGILVCADTLEDLFRTAGRALMEWIGPLPAGTALVKVRVEVSADDREALLVRWLQELIYRFHSGHLYVSQIPELSIHENRLRALLVCNRWDECSRLEYREVKAATYHRLRVVCLDGTWEASIILDV